MSYHNIPAELQVLNQWVCWRLELTDTGKETKVPYDAKTGRMASHADPTTWSSFEQVRAVVGNYSGIGFVFSYADPYCGIDLDVKEDTDADTFARQKKIFKAMDSYSELSPSGMGLHIIVKAKVEHGRKRQAVEVYSNLRYFTFTGNVFDGKSVIHERQELVNVLWGEMGAASQTESIYAGKPTQSIEDDELFTQICSAQNGDKFMRLWQGDKSDYDGDWSRADQALMNFLAYHSGHIPQMVRMFRSSILGDREKAMRDKYMEYTYKRAFDLTLPPIDLSAIIDSMNSAATVLPPPETGSQIGAALSSANRDAAPVPNQIDLDYWKNNPPPGHILNDLSKFIYDHSPRPVREIAIAGAIALMAGICGRAYNISNTGLNMYIMLLAPTGRGKEAIKSGINAIVSRVAKDDFEAFKQFIGPGDMASGTGLLRHLSERVTPSFMSLIGEVGMRLQQMSDDRANPADKQLRRVLLDLYAQSGYGEAVWPSVYADSKNNVEQINSPNFSLLGESVPDEFYKSLSLRQIKSGLIPRFTIVEYDGRRVPLNKEHSRTVAPISLVKSMSLLGELAMKHNNAGTVHVVGILAEAEGLLDTIDIYCDEQINNNKEDGIAQLWNRHHLKVLKLAALLAVSVNMYEPVIDLHMVKWANSLLTESTLKLAGKFERGEVGEEAATHETEQLDEIKKFLKRYMQNDLPPSQKNSVTIQMYRDKMCISKSTIQAATRGYKSFKEAKDGALTALNKRLANLVEFGLLQRVNRDQTDKWFGSFAETYVYTKEAMHTLMVL